MKNRKIEFEVWGDMALFSDPITKIGGEKTSYPIPTYEALVGITKAIYWKPSITWIIDEVRIMNPINLETRGTRPISMDGKNSLAYATYLEDVRYQVKAHYEFNKNRKEFKQDWSVGKHTGITRRSLAHGGRFTPLLGTSECYAYVKPCKFGEGVGYYDEQKEMHFGVMFHGFNYADVTGRDTFEARLWIPKMEKGVVQFIKPEECSMVRVIEEATQKDFSSEYGEMLDE